ncbi:hypothetical protein [Cohnella sp. GCM10027633]|uniref:hypothetical protein n=1 Tax=unclassified Cohnella TaxID=2636738 RepID=UPI003641DC13
MRKLQSTFETNGSRAIVVPKTFSSDIAGKYGAMKRGAQKNRTSLVYRTASADKKKSQREKPTTIVRVQVNMPQPAPIVKVQETKIIRERVVVKDNPANIPDVQRERAEREKPVVRERIVERDKPVVRERIVEQEKQVVRDRIVEQEKQVVRDRILEREKSPVVRERIVERDKPVVRERIVEREKSPNTRQRAVDREKTPFAQARLADRLTRMIESARNENKSSRKALKPAERRERISRIFNEQSTARELAFRLLEEATHLTDESPTGEDTAMAGSPLGTDGTSPRRQSQAARQSRNMINARKGSIEPPTYKQKSANAAQQRIRISQRNGASRPWSAVVMINRSRAERLKPQDRLAPMPNVVWKLATQQRFADRYIESRGSETVREVARRDSAERAREASSPNGEGAASREIRRIAEERQERQERQANVADRGTTSEATAISGDTQRPSKADAQSSQRDGAGRGKPIDRLELDRNLLGDEPTTDEVTVTTSGGLPPLSASLPIRLRVVGTDGITVRLLSAKAERLGATLFLRGRADPASRSMESPSASRLILRKLASSTDTFATAKRAPLRGDTPSQSTAPSATGNAMLNLAETARTPSLRDSAGTPVSNAPNASGNRSANGTDFGLSPNAANAPNNPRSQNSRNSQTVADAVNEAGLRKEAVKIGALNVGDSASSPSAVRMPISARTVVRRSVTGGTVKTPPRATPAGTIVHASKRWLAAAHRAQRNNNGLASASAGRQPNAATADPSASPPARSSASNAASTTLRNQRNNAAVSVSGAGAASARHTNAAGPGAETRFTNVAGQATGRTAPGADAQASAAADSNMMHAAAGGTNDNAAPALNTTNAAITTPDAANSLAPDTGETIASAKLSRRKQARMPELMHREPGEAAKAEEAERAVADPATSQPGQTAAVRPSAGTEELAASEELPVRARPIERSGESPAIRFTFRNRPIDSAGSNKPASAGSAARRQSVPQARISARPTRESLPSAARDEGGTLQGTRATLVARRRAEAGPRNASMIQRLSPRSVATANGPMTAAGATRSPSLASSLMRERAPMTTLLYPDTGAMSDSLQGHEANTSYVAQPMAPMTTLRRQQQQQASGRTSAKASAAPAPAAMELRRQATPQTPPPAEPAPAAVTVEAPPSIDAKQLQKAIESMPQLHPDQLADRVYTALMKKMKFEQRLRGF